MHSKSRHRCKAPIRPTPTRQTFHIGLAFLMVFFVKTAWADNDPLPSWNNTHARASIVAFVKKVSLQGSPDYVPPAQRIAVFDNDGTLWCENPVPIQLAFAFDEIKRLLPQNPQWKNDEAVQALLNNDMERLTSDHLKGAMHILALTHTGITPEEFSSRVTKWFATAQHPRFQRPYSECVYQPMLEVLSYLRANGFKTWIVSGGGLDFMRVFSEQLYGIPTEQVIGSHGQLTFEMKEGKPVLTKTMDSIFIDDKEGKPVGIYQFIGRRPIASFGNSDGDQAMLEYTTIDNPRPSFGLIVHHTDAKREYAYDVKPKSSGKLITALEVAPQHGWTVVDMAKDWNRVFSPE